MSERQSFVSARTTARQVEAAIRRSLRRHIGLWPLLEARNRTQYAVATRRWWHFENAEVARLVKQIGPVRPALVATVMPTYRRPSQLVAAVESALAQTLEDQTIVVVDDGGGLPALPTDPRLIGVSLSRNSHVLGLVRNVGIRLSSSRYIAFLDDDNTWAPNHLEVAVAALEAGADLVYTAVERRRPDGELLDVLSHDFDRNEFRDVSSYVDSNSIVVRRDPRVIFSRLPRVRTTLPKEDWEFVYRLSKHRRVRHLPERTVRYLVNEDSYYTAWRPDPAATT
jgi:Glycosyl transferase family 2